ncbi:hypothetical protein [Nitrospira sp. BLG_2]|uniref:terminase small subunit-like protein n=1 Tax=Nitrospira sp. BLG_2 TaxID=3397507 RepID=UPI003B9C77F4
MSLADVRYNGKIVQKICNALQTSILGLDDLCKERRKTDPSFPTASTILAWRARYPRFRDKFNKSRRIQLSNRRDAIVDQIFSEKNPGMYTDRDGNLRHDSAYVNLMRLRHEVVNYNTKTNEEALGRPPLIINIPGVKNK